MPRSIIMYNTTAARYVQIRNNNGQTHLYIQGPKSFKPSTRSRTWHYSSHEASQNCCCMCPTARHKQQEQKTRKLGKKKNKLNILPRCRCRAVQCTRSAYCNDGDDDAHVDYYCYSALFDYSNDVHRWSATRGCHRRGIHCRNWALCLSAHRSKLYRCIVAVAHSLPMWLTMSQLLSPSTVVCSWTMAMWVGQSM